MGHRFFVDSLVSADRAILVGSEAHHLQHVMRAGVGDEITLFDGSGREFVARIDHVKKSHVELTITATAVVDRELTWPLVVGVALPKGDRQRWLVEKLVEVGASRLVPLRTERGTVHPERQSLDKLSRFVIEASKQCGRNRLMEVAPLMGVADFLAAAPAPALRWVADPAGDRCGTLVRPVIGQHGAYLAVGPEGGFSQAECQSVQTAGWQLVSLGPRILRIETACLVLATLVSPDFPSKEGGNRH